MSRSQVKVDVHNSAPENCNLPDTLALIMRALNIENQLIGMHSPSIMGQSVY